MLSTVITVIVAGRLVGQFGYYWPFLVAGPVFQAVGGALLYTVGADTSDSKLIGFQILTGVGIGCTLQNAIFAIQAEFDNTPKLVAQATGMTAFFNFLGGTVVLAVGQSVFASEIKSNLQKYAPGVDPSVAVQSPSNIRSSYDTEEASQVIEAYVETLKSVFLVGVGGGQSFFFLLNLL